MELTLESLLKPNDNKLLSVSLSVILILYTGLIAPKLSHSITKHLDNLILKFLLLFILVIWAYKDSSSALIAFLAILTTFQTEIKNKINLELEKLVEENDKKKVDKLDNVDENVMDTIVEDDII